MRLQLRRETAVAAALVFSLFLVASVAPATADYLSEWNSNFPVLGLSVTPYPEYTAAESCVAASGVVYCVGGLNISGMPVSSVYSAPVSKLGVKAWTNQTSYPTDVAGESCFLHPGYVYCVGGLERAQTNVSQSLVSSSVYYAPLVGSQIGNWTETSSYPFGVYDTSCSVASDTVYCIGGHNETSVSVDLVEYASLSSAGVSAWKDAGRYPLPVSGESCSTYVGTLYCVGGLNATSIAVGDVYHAPLAGGALNWAKDVSYPNPVAGQSCLVHTSTMYCVAGLNATSLATRAVYLAALDGSHLIWKASVFYPIAVQGESCAIDSNEIYCFGGFDGFSLTDHVFFSTIGTPQQTATQTSTTSDTTSSTTGTASAAATGSSGQGSVALIFNSALIYAVSIAVAVAVAGVVARRARGSEPRPLASP